MMQGIGSQQTIPTSTFSSLRKTIPTTQIAGPQVVLSSINPTYLAWPTVRVGVPPPGLRLIDYLTLPGPGGHWTGMVSW